MKRRVQIMLEPVQLEQLDVMGEVFAERLAKRARRREGVGRSAVLRKLIDDRWKAMPVQLREDALAALREEVE